MVFYHILQVRCKFKFTRFLTLSLLLLVVDESTATMKGQYKLGVDSTVSSLNDGSVTEKNNLFAIAAEGTGNFLILAAISPEDKSEWVSTINGYIETVRSGVL